jgi:hypothetical protein
MKRIRKGAPHTLYYTVEAMESLRKLAQQRGESMSKVICRLILDEAERQGVESTARTPEGAGHAA